ncbi:MAG: hypothetical protein U0736_16615 [Gemmataceae bacterium]
MRHPFDGIIQPKQPHRRSWLRWAFGIVAGLFGGSLAAKAAAPPVKTGQPTSGRPVTTLAVGEEGGTATTLRLKEEGGGRPTTLRVGEEGGVTTYALGVEGGRRPTTLAVNEEGGRRPTTLAVGEEGGASPIQ